MAEETLGRRLGKIVNETREARIEDEQARSKKVEDYKREADGYFHEIIKGLENKLQRIAKQERTELSIFSEFGVECEIFQEVCLSLTGWCIAKDLDYNIEQRMADDGCLYDNFVVSWQDQVVRQHWRKRAKVWAANLKATQPPNDRPPGFDPDDEDSYPFKMPEDWQELASARAGAFLICQIFFSSFEELAKWFFKIGIEGDDREIGGFPLFTLGI